MNSTGAGACGVKVFMGCSTGGLLVDKQEDLERIFASGNRIIGVHAEDETRLHQRRRLQFSRTHRSGGAFPKSATTNRRASPRNGRWRWR